MSTGAKECGFEKKNRDGHTCTKGYQTGIRITVYTVNTPGTLIPKVCTVDLKKVFSANIMYYLNNNTIIK